MIFQGKMVTKVEATERRIENIDREKVDRKEEGKCGQCGWAGTNGKA